jgi:hypothetical protein
VLLAEFLSKLLRLSLIPIVLAMNLLVTIEDMIICILLFESLEEESIPYPEALRGRKLFQLVDIALFEINIKRVHVQKGSLWVADPLAEALPDGPALAHCLAVFVTDRPRGQ